MDQLKRTKKRKDLKQMAKADIMKKYKLKTLFCRTVGIKIIGRCEKSPKIPHQEKLLVRDFFLRSDNSRIVNGKKNTVTKLKVKKQKRLLCDTLNNLYKKFTAENNSSRSISFTTFWRLKPFWIKQATETDRKTCQCKTCENIKFQANTLFKNGVLETCYLPILLQDAACSTLSKLCMYGECKSCPSIVKDKLNMEGVESKQVSWFQWKTKKEKRILLNNKEKQVSFITKESVSGSIMQLCKEFCQNMTVYKRHVYNINSQFKHFEKIKHNLKPNEMLVHIDFAQNYLGKLHTEVQSKHFGASKTQVSLHIGFYQVSSQDKDSSEKTFFSFCGVSDSLKHTPSAIWAYLEPILTEVKSKYKIIDVVHFFSDGPSSQYRQKSNFFLFTHFMKAVGFKHAFWNFFEAGHGKGVPDAIGSAVKQAADRLVKYGHDIINAADLVKHVGANGTETKLYEIPVDKIDKNENIIPNLKAVPGTMKLHQIQVCQESPSTISYRDVSCGCDENIVLSPSYKLDTAAALHTLHLCDSFGLLRHECEALQIHLEPLTGRQRSLSGDKLTLNTFSSELIPTDAQDKTLFAVKHRNKSLLEMGKAFLQHPDCSPTYTNLARLSLTIPLTSLPCERRFSAQHRVHTGLRSSLTTKGVNNKLIIWQEVRGHQTKGWPFSNSSKPCRSLFQQAEPQQLDVDGELCIKATDENEHGPAAEENISKAIYNQVKVWRTGIMPVVRY
ncbi:hypothetical protein RRG08_047188 [Elysia crispata]|uniref:HAT C-terminal dimerisation domain-containing protein n=1 Tax=Elysia crispata TaxID=231223 RepID=A0AAE0YMZ5_9GAST|nr:hypothetical protein RRG08_047188 [Elysia crispata]